MKSVPESKHICLAVLPLQNMSDDRSIDMFCRGLVMDVITDLSRFRSFDIISYDTVKNLHPNEQIDGASLGDLQTDNVVTGLVRYLHEKLIFNIQLINSRRNRLVWAEKFSGKLEEIFQIQEEIVEKIVVSLQHFLDYDLLNTTRKKPITNLNAYECWLKGLEELKKGSLETDEQARQYFRKAIEIDPHYARAYTGMSLSYFNEWSCQIWDRWEVSQKGAFDWAKKAVELDERDHISTVILGKIYLFNGEYEKAEHYLRKGLRLNPNDADNLVQIAYGLVYLGYPEEALKLYEKARRLKPSGDDACFACGAFIHIELGNIDQAIDLADKHQVGKGWVDFPAYFAAACYLQGDYKKMEEYWQHYLEEFSQKINNGKPADTSTALKWMMDVNPYKSSTRIKPFWDHMANGEEILQSSDSEKEHRQVNIFKQEDQFWTFTFAGKQAQLKELKGFHDLRRLLTAPNTAIHCTELMGVAVLEKGEKVFDDQAKSEYRKRILDLQQEIEEAENRNEIERTGTLQEEYDRLLDHLSKSLGLAGKTRKTTGTVEKARSAVTWRIRSAIEKIENVHPDLGKHLDVSIQTGVFCEYTPEYEISWTT